MTNLTPEREGETYIPSHPRAQARAAGILAAVGEPAAPNWYRIEAKADGTAESAADVYIYDEIGYWGTSAKDFTAQVAGLDVDTINLFVNSPGGNAWDGVAIMNALRRHRARVQVTVDGIAASAASLICMAGDHITMNRSAQMMIHDTSGMAWGNAQTMRETADLLDKLSDSYADAYAKRAGGTRAQWRDVMRAETWYTAEEAVLAGVADEWDGSADTKAAAHDLSRFTYAGRLAAPAPALPAVAALHVPPATSEPGQPTERQDAMSDSFMAGLRERLGISDAGTSEDAVLAALDEALAEQADAPPAPVAALPEGVVAIEAAMLNTMRSELDELRAIRTEQADATRAALVEAAIADGRIPPARREHWVAALKADEEGMAPVLASLAPNTVPLAEIGHSDDVETSDEVLYTKAWGSTRKEA
ncbi:ATP-dependent Clp protease proteolytic subunit [Tessaracoccus sp. MC1627]|uniref:head maturation protease, ClpP-related n=1 Tax=Tessaracoccus sp. MC1627 TaxID=2760312 RepID=UPI0015FEE6AF|nr:head maturation protease, ClpP-related [Tessaracoccus sp. MC1627]MBB1511981.1 ATP-dependent Clp protease proteolytic subunit [Tessaracoccus sp. MC1627]